MTPDQIAKSDTEHAHQTALFFYCSVVLRQGWKVAEEWCATGEMPRIKNGTLASHMEVPALEWIHAIPNGGSRGDDEETRAIRGGALKAEGVRKGVADIFLPWPVNGWHGLYIEMKKPSEKPKRETSKGGVKEDQQRFGDYAQLVGYGWIVCYSWREAATILRQYIEGV